MPLYNCCKALLACLGASRIAFPESAAYNKNLSSYFSLGSSALEPACFASPQSTAEVSKAVTALVQSFCHFAIRSGGHMWVPGASNIDGGVTLDLSGLNSIEVNNSTVSVGTGASWEAVYAELEPLGLGVNGGRIAGVAGGLTLGGGISHFGPRYGWTCDTVLAFEVVLASGEVVIADGTHNTDLFHGLKGGSNNFGVVTRVELQAFEQGRLWSSITNHAIDGVDDHVRVFAELAAAENYDEYAAFLTAFGFTQSDGQTAISNLLYYTEATEQPEYFRNFLNLPSVSNSSNIAPMSQLASEQAVLWPPGEFHYVWGTTSFHATEAMLRAAYDAWADVLEGVRDVEGLTFRLVLEPLPPAIYDRDAKGNVLGLEDRSGTLVVCFIDQGFSNSADHERVSAASQALIVALDKAAHRLNAYDPYVYLNYAAPWQDPITSYGTASVAKLRKLQARVDPDGVFTTLVAGAFKIPPKH